MKQQVREWIKTRWDDSRQAKSKKATSFEEMKLMMEAMGIPRKAYRRIVSDTSLGKAVLELFADGTGLNSDLKTAEDKVAPLGT